LLFFIFLIFALVYSIPDLFHHSVIKIKIVENTQPHSQHFLCLQQMADISPAVMTACRTLAAFFYRSGIELIFSIKQVDLSEVCIYMAMPSVTAWIYTVEEIHSSGDGLQDIGRRSHSHQISRLIHREIWNHTVQDPVHFLVGLPYSQSADGIAIQIQLGDLL